MFVSLFKWLQETAFFSFIWNSPYSYPVILSLHIVALAFFGGMILVTDLRLLGLGMRGYSASEIVQGLRIPKRFGFIFIALSGALLFGSRAEQYSYNRWFWIKIALLGMIAVNYLLFRRDVYSNAIESNRALQIPGQGETGRRSFPGPLGGGRLRGPRARHNQGHHAFHGGSHR